MSIKHVAKFLQRSPPLSLESHFHINRALAARVLGMVLGRLYSVLIPTFFLMIRLVLIDIPSHQKLLLCPAHTDTV